MYKHDLDVQRARQLYRICDPSANRPFTAGDRVVICARDHWVYLETTWRHNDGRCQCGGAEALKDFSAYRPNAKQTAVASNTNLRPVSRPKIRPITSPTRSRRNSLRTAGKWASRAEVYRYLRWAAISIFLAVFIGFVSGKLPWASQAPLPKAQLRFRVEAHGKPLGPFKTRFTYGQEIALVVSFGQTLSCEGVLEVRLLDAQGASLAPTGPAPFLTRRRLAGRESMLHIPLHTRQSLTKTGSYRVELWWHEAHISSRPEAWAHANLQVQ